MTTVGKLTEEQLEEYRAGARRRRQREQRALELRRERAWALARQAAALLRNRFQAERVVVFGSLTRPDCFTEWSDVDIAAWGLRPEDTFKAIGAVMDLSDEIALNLVDVGAYKQPILESIERDGLPL